MAVQNRIILLCFTGICLLSILACNSSKESSEDQTEEPGHKEEVVQKVSPIILTWQDTIRCKGRIEVPPQNRISVHSAVTAFVQEIHFYSGSAVRKGDPLVRLMHPSFIEPQRNFLEALSQRSFLRNENERHEELLSKSAVSSKAAQRAEAEYLLNEARIQSAKTELEMMGFNTAKIATSGLPQRELIIRSPVNGFISHMTVNKGKLVNPNDFLVELIDKEHIHLELEVYGSDISGIEKGMKVLFKPHQSSRLFEAEVYLINPIVQENTNTVQIHAHLNEEDEQDPILKPGMLVQAVIPGKIKSSWALPLNAVHESEDGGQARVEVLQNAVWKSVAIDFDGLKDQYALIAAGHELCDSTQIIKIPSFGGEH
jgi:cobalt-zinc-cadmium efflux system membrane fusion protein